MKQFLLCLVVIVGMVGLVGCSKDDQELQSASMEEKKVNEDKYFIEIENVEEVVDFLENDRGFFMLGDTDDQPGRDMKSALKQAAIQTEVPVVYFSPSNYEDSNQVREIVVARNVLLNWKGLGEKGMDKVDIYVNDYRESESLSNSEAVERYSLFLNENGK